jgi:prevent-host-death family protein
MIDVSRDIQSMTTFKRNSAGLVKRMRKSGRPLVLTVKGKAEVVVMDAGTYQQLADRIDTVEGIRRGLAQASRGLGRSVDEVFDDIERRA